MAMNLLILVISIRITIPVKSICSSIIFPDQLCCRFYFVNIKNFVEYLYGEIKSNQSKITAAVTATMLSGHSSN
ncbi:hypothetical protein DERP_001506 [Dermatophagoides pteronyssinus]|uniref:Secreted protein n=1 Tax=Dermatophagoides pteronyssinus TaxID=6956 RepID=A0ABQ8JEN1_DERPT|nr:hypothetical protein DERP_001506 [Dermatophagoides pteronyssinus]